jgi:zinc protease
MKNILFFLFLFSSSFLVSKTLPDSTESITDSLQKEIGKDTLDSEIPEGLTAKNVIDNYIEAIGGAEKIYNIVDRTTIMRGSVQGINITIVSYQKAPNKLKQKIKAGANEQLIIFNGEKGIMEMAGEKNEITGAELEKLKYEATLTLLTDPEYYGIKLNLDGVEKINEEDAYKIIMTLPSGIKWSQFYDTESGLKVKEEKYINSPMGLFLQVITFDDYKEVEGMLYPFEINQKIGAQSMEFTVSSIKINTGLIDREFEL